MFDARYAYARVSFTYPEFPGIEAVIGVELPEGRRAKAFYEELREALYGPILAYFDESDEQIARVAEAEIRENWPGQSYFIEVGRGEHDEWVQVFEPKGHSQ